MAKINTVFREKCPRIEGINSMLNSARKIAHPTPFFLLVFFYVWDFGVCLLLCLRFYFCVFKNQDKYLFGLSEIITTNFFLVVWKEGFRLCSGIWKCVILCYAIRQINCACFEAIFALIWFWFTSLFPFSICSPRQSRLNSNLLPTFSFLLCAKDVIKHLQ